MSAAKLYLSVRAHITAYPPLSSRPATKQRDGSYEHDHDHAPCNTRWRLIPLITLVRIDPSRNHGMGPMTARRSSFHQGGR